MDEKQFKEQVMKLKTRLNPPDDMDTETFDKLLEQLVEDTFYIAMNNLYPFENEYPDKLPKKYENWQIRVCKYLWTNAKFLGIIQYSENGVTLIFNGDYIPNTLMNELIPYAKLLRR